MKITFNVSSDIGAALNFSKTHDHDAEAMYLAKAEMFVKKELFSKKQCSFNALMAHLMPTVSDLKYLNYTSRSWT